MTSALAISACGGPSTSNARDTIPATTGFFDAEGIDYTDGGDPRVEEALRQLPPPKGGGLNERLLSHRLKEFALQHLEQEKIVVLTLQFHDRNAVTARLPVTKSPSGLSLTGSAGGIQIQGTLEDLPAETRGEFTLQESNQQHARLFYRAFKSVVNVRSPGEPPAGSRAAERIRELQAGASARVQNFVVLNGPSTYQVEIFSGGQTELFRFKGESKRTGAREHEAVLITPSPRTEVRLIGNSETDSRRLFSVSMRDTASGPPEEFLIEVSMAAPAPPRAVKPEDIPVETEPSKPARLSYMAADVGTPRSRHMARDFAKNAEVPGVRKHIARFQRAARAGLENFFKYANPFRPMIESIGAAFDVSPAFAYLTVVESAYFTGGRYEIQKAATSTALGPFQLLDGTARELGLKVTGLADDERRFFAPSACGAARYIGKMVNQFSGSDATVAILAYYQGDGGAAAAIHCSYGGTPDPKECARQINRSYSAADYARFKRLARAYKFTYAEMDRLAVLPLHMRDYVNKKLAVYFISSDLLRYGFAPSADAPKGLPQNGTVFPPNAITDEQCRKAVATGT